VMRSEQRVELAPPLVDITHQELNCPAVRDLLCERHGQFGLVSVHPVQTLLVRRRSGTLVGAAALDRIQKRGRGERGPAAGRERVRRPLPKVLPPRRHMRVSQLP